MNEFLTVINGLSPIALVVVVIITVSRLLTPITHAYAANVSIRANNLQEQAKDAQRRREREDQLALELAEYKKEQAEINLQTALVNAKIAEQLPALIGTQQQTLATVQQTRPQVEAVRGELAELIQQLHDITTSLLAIVDTKQDDASARLGRIEDAQAAEHDTHPDDTTPPAES